MESASDLAGGTVPSRALLGVPLVLLLAYFVMYPVSMDPEEPPLIRPKVPFIGHIIGLMQHAWKYLTMIHTKNDRPAIFTLPMLTGKVYVIPDPDLAQSALRNRALSFDPFLRDLIKGFANASRDTMRVWDDPAFAGPWIKIIRGGMAGQALLQLNVAALGNVAASLNNVDADGVEVENLYRWNRDLVTLASTDSLYGSRNPFRADKRLIGEYWTYEGEIHKLMPNVLPWLVAPKGHRARKVISSAIARYFDAGHHLAPDVPPLVGDRRKLTASFDMPSPEAAAIELIFFHGAVSNTFPTYYWFFTHVFHQPALLARLREEALGVIEENARNEADGKTKVVTLHVERLEEKCPLLMSCFRETHRLSTGGIFARQVLADTTISDGGKRSYLLKKGWHVQVPQAIMQTDPETWGENPLDFVGDRFLKLAQGTGEPVTTFSARGFMPFGCGKHLCPGRSFASGELLGSIVLLIMGFDITGPDGGAVPIPRRTDSALTGSIGKPVPGSDLRGRIRRRAGWEDVQWEVTV